MAWKAERQVNICQIELDYSITAALLLEWWKLLSTEGSLVTLEHNLFSYRPGSQKVPLSFRAHFTLLYVSHFYFNISLYSQIYACIYSIDLQYFSRDKLTNKTCLERSQIREWCLECWRPHVCPHKIILKCLTDQAATKLKLANVEMRNQQHQCRSRHNRETIPPGTWNVASVVLTCLGCSGQYGRRWCPSCVPRGCHYLSSCSRPATWMILSVSQFLSSHVHNLDIFFRTGALQSWLRNWRFPTTTT